MGAKWRRCQDCGTGRAVRHQSRCRPCHGRALLDALDRAVIASGEMDGFHRWQHEYYRADETTCPRSIQAADARRRLTERAAA